LRELKILLIGHLRSLKWHHSTERQTYGRAISIAERAENGTIR